MNPMPVDIGALFGISSFYSPYVLEFQSSSVRADLSIPGGVGSNTIIALW